MIAALQAAVYSALSNDAAFNAAVGGRIYDKPPQQDDPGSGSQFPYAVIGFMDVEQWATDDWSGEDLTFDVFVYSRYGGNKEAAEALDLARDVFDRQALTISGRTAATVDFEESAGVSVMADGQTRVGEITFSALLYP